MWSNIVPGSGIAVVAPASPVRPTDYHHGLAILASRYRIVHAYTPEEPIADLPYLAGNDLDRVHALHRAIADRAVDAIFCARGGYGTLRMLEHLEDERFLKRRVPIIGFSDITALHAWAFQRDLPTIHGPVVTQLGKLPQSEVEGLFALLEARVAPRFDRLKKIIGGRASGRLFAANLTVLTHLLGTPYMPNLSDGLLLLEDIGEAPYRIDRMLTQLHLNGALDRIRGVILGEFLDCEGPRDTPSRSIRAEEVIGERLSSLNIPLASGAPVGHGTHNVALPIGQPALLDVDAGTLEFTRVA